LNPKSLANSTTDAYPERDRRTGPKPSFCLAYWKGNHWAIEYFWAWSPRDICGGKKLAVLERLNKSDKMLIFKIDYLIKNLAPSDLALNVDWIIFHE